MTVREFLDVVNFEIVDYAQIYEKIWNEDYQDYDTKATDKRVNTKKDLEQYLDYELDYLDYETHWGEYDDSAIYIKMPKEDTPMTPQKAIEELKSYADNSWGSLNEAFEMAIKALEKSDYDEQRMLVLEQQGGII